MAASTSSTESVAGSMAMATLFTSSEPADTPASEVTCAMGLCGSGSSPGVGTAPLSLVALKKPEVSLARVMVGPEPSWL